MKKLFTILFFVILTTCIIAQKNNWTTTNLFQTDVFVENFGQFDNWAKTDKTIKYAVNNSDIIFFTQHGLVYEIDKVTKLSKEERKEIEQKTGKKEPKIKAETYYVNMEWEGSNANATIEVTEQAQGYYTFGEKGYESLRAKGYRKLTYKNLYDNIDVEYIIPDKGGIKYSIILHKGADLSKLKMHYTGDVEKISKDNEGNIIVATPAGNITDHAPKSFYEKTKESIASSFEINKNTISFKIINNQSSIDNIVIDPWVTVTTSLTSNNKAYDVASDINGNVYVSGGASPYKVAKYNSTGTILWTFSYPFAWGSDGYSKFCLIPNTGTIFIGEAFTTGTGPRVMKISNGGNIVITSSLFSGNQEIWVILYNRCTNQLMAFGGGSQSSNNLQLISDTNLTSSSAHNINGFTTTCNDIGSAVIDNNNGDTYALYTSNTTPNYIQKNTLSSNYNSPLAFNINTGYSFSEYTNNGITTLSYTTVRANALALNSNYLFSYDGQNLKIWNKSDGSLFNTTIASSVYPNGANRFCEGIAVDGCNNIWVGGFYTVHAYAIINGYTAVAQPITTNIIGEVYDINYNPHLDLLSVCGNGFLTTLNVNHCVSSIFNVNNNLIYTDCYNGVISAITGGGVPPYTYLWSTGATTSSINVTTSGTYSVTVSENSCAQDTIIASTIVSTGVLSTPATSAATTLVNTCLGSSNSLFTIGGSLGTGADWYWYTGSCGGTVAGVSSPALIYPAGITTYWVRAEGLCNTTTCISITVSLISSSSVEPLSVSAVSSVICLGSSITLAPSGGTLGSGANWYWYNGVCGNNLIGSGAALIQIPTTSITYYVRAEGACNTTFCVSVTISVNNLSTAPSSATATSPICLGQSSTFGITGGSLGTDAIWNWYSGSCNGTYVTSGASPVLSPTISAIYYIKAESSCNTTSCISISVIVNNISVAANAATSTLVSCFGSTTLGLSGGSLGTSAIWKWYTDSCAGTYLSSGAIITQNPSTITTYYVRAEGICNTTTCVSITIANSFSTAATSASSYPLDLCAGASNTLSVIGGALGLDANWNWYSGSCGGTFVGSGISIIHFPTASATYYVRAEGLCNSTACVSVSIILLGISYNPISINATPTSIFYGNSSFLSQTGGILGDAANWYWYTDSCRGNLVGIGDTLTLSPLTTTTYWVRAVGFCNTTTCMSITVTVFPLTITITSIEPKNDISFYPNPTSSDFTLKINESNATLNIYNIAGQLLKEEKLKKGENLINAKFLSKGEYILEIKSEGNKYRYKIIKQ